MNLFKLRKEEILIALVALFILASLDWMMISQYSPLFLKGGKLGFWSIFAKNFRMSGYDCWSYITISNLRIHFETIRHPLFLSILYPLYLLNHWLMYETGTNYAVYMMAALITFCSVYSIVFMYRIFKQVIELSILDSLLLVLSFYSIGHIMVTMIVPDHFAISLFLLTMTLYISGMKIKSGKPMKLWHSAVLLFMTAGVTLTNGAKTLLAALFLNGKSVFKPKFIITSVIAPLILLLGIYWYQHKEFEVPQERVVHKIENGVKKKKTTDFAKDNSTHKKWIENITGKPFCNAPLLDMTDASTPRIETAVENLFGESIQLHQGHLLEDMSYTRPVFVKYNCAFNYIVEGLIFLIFALSLWCGRYSKFLCLCMSWFTTDLILHMVLGFGINEVYIMSADWIFIIPIAFACMLKSLRPKPQMILRIINLCITIYLIIWNGSLLISYLNIPYGQLIKD